MFLKSLELNGFKSFADKTHIDFTDGITSLLGPNGCGKSNIVDSIKWVLGEQSTKTLRASRMDDVIFSGTETRKPSSMAEVTLTIDNENRWLPTDVPEIVIRRRLFRNGEGEYYLNGQKCLLRNIKDLFLDTGVGKSAYSILEQGKIDQILSNKPEDRRYIFEEAAGISRFKVKCTEAQNKIALADGNIEKLSVTLKEVKRTYDRTKTQAEKALKWQELKDRAFYLDVDMKLSRTNMFLALREQRMNEETEARKKAEELRGRMGEFDDIISSSSSELTQYQNESKNLEVEIGKVSATLSSVNETILALKDSYRQYVEKYESSEKRCSDIEDEINRTKTELETAEDNYRDLEERLEEKKTQAEYAETTLSGYRSEIASLNESIREAENSNSELDDSLKALSEELRNVIESLIKEVDENTGTEYSASRRDDADRAFLDALRHLLEQIEKRRSFISSLPGGVDYSKDMALKDYASVEENISKLEKLYSDYKDSIPPVIDTILSPEGLVSRKRGIVEREDEARKVMLDNRRKIDGARVQIERRESDVESLQGTITSLREIIASLKASIESHRENIQRLKDTVSRRGFDLQDERDAAEIAHKRVYEVADRIQEKNDEIEKGKKKVEELRSTLQDVNGKLDESLRALSEKRREKETLLSSINQAESDAVAAHMRIEQCDKEIETIFTNFFETYARNLNEFKERLLPEMPDETVLRKEFDEVNNEIKALGNINHAAKDEYDEAEDQYKFLSKQLDDYTKAKTDMESVLGEILDKSRDMFLKSYKEISTNFQTMFTRLFGGGKAELSLTEPDEVLTSGIEILAQPPGKSMSTLSLLSGGERSMTAVALLFATYQVKPSPFCILDEIDAALDDRNIGYFLDVLQDFARESQFIIITHNTHTVTGGNAMLGVSQMEAGVSTAVSYRIASIEGQPRILNDEGAEVEFDEEGRRK
jgi:chromosome segregation protein